MSIRDKNGKLAITPGEWHSTGDPVISSDRGRDVADTVWSNNPTSDALLIAEAGTIANRYDSTPAEMVETIRDLRGLIDFIEEECVMDVFEYIGIITTIILSISVIFIAAKNKRKTINILPRIFLGVIFFIPAWVTRVYAFCVCKFVTSYENKHPEKAEYFALRGTPSFKDRDLLEKLKGMETDFNLYPGGLKNKISGLILEAFRFRYKRILFAKKSFFEINKYFLKDWWAMIVKS